MGFFRSLGRLFGGSRPKMKQVPRYTPAQESALNQLLQAGLASADPAALEKRYRSQFERETVPGLAERFTAMGGGQRSSAFEESLRRGGLDLGEQLAGLRQQYGLQAMQAGLQPRFDTVMTPGSPGLLGGLAGGLTGMLGAGLAGKVGGMFGMPQAGQVPQYRSPLLGAGRGTYMPGQPKGSRRGVNPVLLKILEGIQL